MLFWSYGIFIVKYGSKLSIDFGLKDRTVPFILGLFLFQHLLTGLSEVVNILAMSMSRRFEFQADAFAVKAGRAKELSSALQKLQTDNLGEMDPDWLYSAVVFKHPPLIERLKAIEAKNSEKDYVLVDKKTQ